MSIKFNTLGIIMDTAKIEKAHKLIDSLYAKIKKYNDEVKRANRLLREFDELKKKTNVRFEKGEVKGLPKKPSLDKKPDTITLGENNG